MYKINNYSEHFRGGGGVELKFRGEKSQGSHLLNETLCFMLHRPISGSIVKVDTHWTRSVM